MATRPSRARFALVAAAVLALSLAGPVSAATSATMNEGVTVNETLTLELGSTAFNYNGTNNAALDPGVTSTGQGLLVTAGGNRPWKVVVTGGDFHAGSSVMPGTIRTWRLAEDTTGYHAFDPTGTEVISHGAGPLAQGMFWKVSIPADAAGGEYTSQLTFTVSAQ